MQNLSEQGKLGREEITLLMDALGSRYTGASERASETWDGIISNLRDQWTRFQRMVMASGLFIWMKSQLQELLDTLNRMAANGQLQAWAESVSDEILRVLTAIRDFGVGVYRLWNDTLFPALDSFQRMVGGWDMLGWITLALMFSSTLLTIASGIGKIALGVAAITSAPIFLLALAFIALAAVIYLKWDNIVTYFSDKIEAVRAAFDTGLLNGVLKLLSEFNPFLLLYDALDGLQATLLAPFNLDLFAIGEKWITDLRAGIASQIDALVAWVQAKFAAMIPDMPDWLRSPDAGGTAGIGGDSGYAGMGGAMDTGFEGRALGGPVRAGRMYRWMEEGQEMFVPRSDGTVISTRQLRGLRGGGGRAAPAFHIGEINVTAAPGQSARDVALAVLRELEDMAAGAPLHDGGLHGD